MTKRITLKIDGIECPNCVMKLEGIEDHLPGIILAEASYHKAQMVVEYNETRLNEDQIRSEIQRLGYTVTAVKPG